jgi:hypothetical protein
VYSGRGSREPALERDRIRVAMLRELKQSAG